MRDFHAFCLAAPRSGEGKTAVAVALIRALVRRGLAVQGCKCGPDYIDPTFHALATGRPACNLDTWMMGEAGVRAQWRAAVQGADAAVCEGVMGLLDGRSPDDLSGSTLDCARVLHLPVLLVVNVRGMAASLTALVEGFQQQAARHGVRLAGDSMTPRFADGQIVWAKSAETAENGTIVLCYLNGQGYCKKLRRDGQGVALVSLNPAYQPIAVCAGDEFRIMGVVVG